MLHAIGTEMAGHRDMPMGEHDPQALSSGDAVDALQRMTDVEAQLVARVQELLTEHQAALDAVRAEQR